jgi:hypothetical protein
MATASIALGRGKDFAAYKTVGIILPPNPVTAAMLDSVLASDYRLVSILPDVYPERRQFFYVRKDLLPQNGSASPG